MVEQPKQQIGETRREHLAAAYDIAAGLINGTQSLDRLADDIHARGKPCLNARLKGMAAQ